MSRLRFWSTLIGILCLGAASGAGPPAPAAKSGELPLPPEQVVDHVSRSIAWYRRIVALQQLPIDADDIVPRDRLYQTALTSLQVVFEFGRAAGNLAAIKADGSGNTTNNNPQDAQNQSSSADQAAARIAARIADLQSQLSALDQQIAHARRKDRATLSAKRGEVSAALDLAKEIQGTVGQIQRFEESMEAHTSGAAGGLAAQIADLRKSVPELRTGGRGARAGLISRSFEGGANAPAGGNAHGAGARGGGGTDGGASRGGGSGSEGSDVGGSGDGGSRAGSSDGGGSGGGGSGASGSGGGGSGDGGSAAGSSDGGGSGGGGSGAGGSGGGGSGAGGSATSSGRPPAAALNADTFRPESAGVIALFGKWFSLEGSRRQLLDVVKQTEGLQKDLQRIREQITQEARDLARQSLEGTSADPAQLLQSKQKFEDAARRFKQLSTLLVPLGEQGVTFDTARSILEEWRDSLTARSATIARYLALRLVILFGSIALVLVISEIWRRATFRYLHDTRRRQQFLALRRVAVGLALTFVIMFGLVSEVGSLATYAGLITAGLAVALQNVILAIVAYFFLIGRYGVRVGDRITLAGVTGRVVEIGLVRIYLMELTGPQLRSSGRMVVLSNAVLFQPTALFKQMPGGDYYWHTIALTLAPTTDVEAAEKRLREAAESVYEKYRPAIEQQHAALQRFIDFQTAMPAPEVYARLTAKGLECTVRYPVEPLRGAITDQHMLMALRQAQAKEPPLELVDGPVLETET